MYIKLLARAVCVRLGSTRVTTTTTHERAGTFIVAFFPSGYSLNRIFCQPDTMQVTEAGCDLTYCKMRGIVTVLTGEPPNPTITTRVALSLSGAQRALFASRPADQPFAACAFLLHLSGTFYGTTAADGEKPALNGASVAH